MARRNPSWQIDWAGPHGTAWGTVNGCLTAVTAAVVGHFGGDWWQYSMLAAAVAAAVSTVIGVVLVLLRASVGRRRPAATVLYQAACVVGAGGWVAYMLAESNWSFRWFAAKVGVLAAMAIVAGLLASLASPEPATAASAGETAAGPADERQQQAARDDLAAEWEARLDRLTGLEGWKVPNIETWPRGNGYTVEAVAPPGGPTWQRAESVRDQLEGDLDLPVGGGITVKPGVTRRAALIEATTKDILADDYVYPEDRPAHSINDNLETGIQDDGNLIGPNLRSNCMVLAGETGSGKSNAAQCLTAEIVTTGDALLWEWELAGGALWSDWMEPFLQGEVRTPPIDWCAWDGQELLWMTRAALRVGYTRRAGYRSLMRDADDDKVPVSDKVPGIIVLGDEIAKVTGAMTQHPEAQENLRLLVFELRAAAVRAVFLALRGTDDVITSSIQSQCQVRGVMKIASKAEANWVFGSSFGFGPQDTPYPGCGGLSLASGAAPVRKKWYRMKPSQIRRIVRLAESRRPDLDELSRLAADGRHPDGTPMPDLLEGELDCYSTRWARFRKRYADGAAAVPAGASAPRAVGVQPEQHDAGPAYASPAEAMAALDAAMATLDRAAAAERERTGADGVLSDDERERFNDIARQLAAEGFDDWEDDEDGDEPQPEREPQPGDDQILLDLLTAAGPGGIAPKDLRPQLAERGVVISRDTLHTRLKALREAGWVHQPRHGKWAAGPKP